VGDGIVGVTAPKVRLDRLEKLMAPKEDGLSCNTDPGASVTKMGPNAEPKGTCARSG
jgi:hypothetical protein